MVKTLVSQEVQNKKSVQISLRTRIPYEDIIPRITNILKPFIVFDLIENRLLKALVLPFLLFQ